MKRINLLAGVLFVLAGFCAGIGFNLLPVSTEAQGPPQDPPRPVMPVVHDDTLTGNGTRGMPLGIANGGVRTAQLANGAVTAPKLSAATLPTLGQVLGFNGANLAWQNPPVGGGVRVVDSRGHEVGPLVVPGGSVLRKVGAFIFQLHVHSDGFGESSLSSSHTTTDCSGTRYIGDDTSLLYRNSQNTRTQLFYPADPLQEMTFNSFEQVFPPETGLPPRCWRTNPETFSAGLVATFDLSTLGLVPPFHLEF